MKRIIAIILSIILVFGILPITSFAAETTYDVWVGGVQITESNADNVFGDGTVKFNASTNTLTLNNYSYNGIGYVFQHLGSDSSAALYSALDTLRITAIGSNSITHNEQNYNSYGIYTEGGLIITKESTGSLAVTASKSNTRNIGILVNSNDFIMESGTVIAQGGTAENNDLNTGVWCFSGDIIINENARLTGIGGMAGISRGICASAKILIDGGFISADASPAGQISHGISAAVLESNNDKSKIFATASSADESAGIRIWNDCDFMAGYIQAVSSAVNSNQSYGVLFSADFTISGGTVIAIGTNGAYNNIPNVDSEYTNLGIWYGENKDKATINGVKSIADIQTKYTQKYVRVDTAYTVTYIADGKVVDTQLVEPGKDAVAPAIPEKQGYTQTAPTWDNNGKNITENTQINAVYTVNKYSVTIPIQQIGYRLETDVTEAEHGEDVYISVALKEGYKKTDAFALKVNGAVVELTKFNNIIVPATDDMVITVEGVERKIYTITFMDENGVYKTKTYKHGEKVTMPEPPIKDGYTVKWETIIDKATGNATVKAVYIDNSVGVATEDGFFDEELSPETSDNSNIWLWFALLLVSGVGVLAFAYNERKTKNNIF